MCAWTVPKTFVVGAVLPAGDLNTHLRDNLNYLKGVITSSTSLTQEVTVNSNNITAYNANLIAGNAGFGQIGMGYDDGTYLYVKSLDSNRSIVIQPGASSSYHAVIIRGGSTAGSTMSIDTDISIGVSSSGNINFTNDINALNANVLSGSSGFGRIGLGYNDGTYVYLKSVDSDRHIVVAAGTSSRTVYIRSGSVAGSSMLIGTNISIGAGGNASIISSGSTMTVDTNITIGAANGGTVTVGADWAAMRIARQPYSYETHIEYGITTTNSTGSGFVSFSKAFTDANAGIGLNTGGNYNAWVSAVSTTGFTVQAFDGGTPQAVTVSWVAVGRSTSA